MFIAALFKKKKKDRSRQRTRQGNMSKNLSLREIGKHIWRAWNLPSSLGLSHSPPHECGYLSLWLFVQHVPIH